MRNTPEEGNVTSGKLTRVLRPTYPTKATLILSSVLLCFIRAHAITRHKPHFFDFKVSKRIAQHCSHKNVGTFQVCKIGQHFLPTRHKIAAPSQRGTRGAPLGSNDKQAPHSSTRRMPVTRAFISSRRIDTHMSIFWSHLRQTRLYSCVSCRRIWYYALNGRSDPRTNV